MKKRVLLLLLMLFLAILLLRWICWSGSYEFIHKVDSLDDVKIEIIKVDNSIDSIFETSTCLEESYNEEKIIVLAVIQDKLQFMNDLKQVRSYRQLGSPISSISGVMVRITFPDGEVELISSYGSALISEKDVRVFTKSFDKEEYDDFYLTGFALSHNHWICKKPGPPGGRPWFLHAQIRSAISWTRRSVSAQPMQGSVMDFP